VDETNRICLGSTRTYAAGDVLVVRFLALIILPIYSVYVCMTSGYVSGLTVDPIEFGGFLFSGK